jgi:glutaredoxin-like protein NrdH
MASAKGNVEGSNSKHRTVFYGLSTCVWCKRTRQFLEDADVSFDFFYVDLLQGADRQEVLERIRPWNPSLSFPTVVVDDAESVIGYKPAALQEALGL